MNFFENYAIVAMESDNVTFYAYKMIKGTSGFNLKSDVTFIILHAQKVTLSPSIATIA